MPLFRKNTGTNADANASDGIAANRPDPLLGAPRSQEAARGAEIRLLPQPPFVAYPPIERLAVVGDRRTAAMVAADGTICWWCLPNFDGVCVLGTLLDAKKGGFCRLGPRNLTLGAQAYQPETAVLVTCWEDETSRLELTDAMLWPETGRRPGLAVRRTILRRLRCAAGAAPCRLVIKLRPDFSATKPDLAGLYPVGHGAAAIGVWCSRDLSRDDDEVGAEFALTPGEEVWLVLDSGGRVAGWSIERAREELAAVTRYWRMWSAKLQCRGERAMAIRQSGLMVHLLSFAPTGAPVAAPTAALPERIGGWRNFDYRFSWVRDASLSISLLCELGFTGEEEHYLDWIAALPPGDHMPLQTVYRIDGGTKAPVRKRKDLNGYRESRPVQFGNGAFKMEEIGSLGYLADAIWIYLSRGGTWKDEYWGLVLRLARFAARHWRDRGTGVWELKRRHYTTTRLLAWTVLDRAVKVAELLAKSNAPVERWRQQMEAIRQRVMDRSWRDGMNAFSQLEKGDTLDAALLLMPLMEFLPPDDPRVVATVAQIESRLAINGFLYRYVEEKFPGQGDRPMGEEEGSFAMCTCWLAHYYVQRGEHARADAILRRLEAATRNGLFAEAIDARTGTMLGNTPLLFTQVEYAKAALALAGGSGDAPG